MCLLAICMSSLEKCLFRSFAHLKQKVYLFIYFGCAGSCCGTQDLQLWHVDFLVVACGLLVAAYMRDLVRRPGIKPGRSLVQEPGIDWVLLALGAQSLTHWTTREVPSAHFFIVLFGFLILSSMSCFCILDINPLSITSFCKYFLPFSRLSFHFPDGFLCYAKSFKFDQISFVSFCLYFFCLGRLI